MTSSIRIRSVSPHLASTIHSGDAVVVGALDQRARRRHPVERLVRAAVGVHEHRPVGLDDQQPGGHRQVGGEPAGVVDLAAGDRRVARDCNLPVRPRSDTPVRWRTSPTLHPAARRLVPDSRACHESSAPSASSVWARWVPASPRSSPATGSPSSASSRATSRWPAGAQHIEHSTGPRAQARQAHRGRAARHLRPAHPDDLARADLADCDLVVEAVVERLDLKRAIFQQLDGIVRPDAVLATNTSSLSVTEISAATSTPRPRHRHALLQPGAGAEVRRGDPHGGHRARRRRRGAGAGPQARQEPGGGRRQGRLHRQRAAVRLPQPRGVDVREPLRDAARTSTPRCGSAAATRWARSRCST